MSRREARHRLREAFHEAHRRASSATERLTRGMRETLEELHAAHEADPDEIAPDEVLERQPRHPDDDEAGR